MSREESRLLDKASHALRAARLPLSADEIESAVNRGYYAMFYAASALVARTGRSFRKHSSVHSALGEHFAKTGELDAKYHRWLIDAFDLRAAGDYGVETVLTSEDALALIEHADEFLDVARAWLSGAPGRP